MNAAYAAVQRRAAALIARKGQPVRIRRYHPLTDPVTEVVTPGAVVEDAVRAVVIDRNLVRGTGTAEREITQTFIVAGSATVAITLAAKLVTGLAGQPDEVWDVTSVEEIAPDGSGVILYLVKAKR